MADNAEIFREALVYLARKNSDVKRFGSVELGKMLYYSDCEAYRKHGSSITGVEYYRLNDDTVALGMDDAMEMLIWEGVVRIERLGEWGSGHHAVIALRDACLRGVDENEIAIMDKIAAAFRDMSDEEIQSLSQYDLGWQVVDEGETIPLRTAWFSLRPLTEEQIRVGKEVEARMLARHSDLAGK